jgi:uncharacterized protein involved in outer membrane biogenesis
MKKILKITGIVILAILVVLITVPFLFKGQIKSKVEDEINKNLNAKVTFESLNLSLIRSFPDFYMSLNGLTIVGKGPFEKDTLISFKSFSTRLNLISVIKMENIKIKSIILDSPNINAIVLKDGKANWDITLPSTDTTKADTTTSQPSTFKLSLKKFAIINANIVYDDRQGGMKASLKNFNFNLAGDLSSDFTTLDINSSTDAINFVMGGIPYLKNASNKMKIVVDADLKNNSYTLKENEFAINDIVLGWNGTVALKDTNTIVDVTFNTKKTDFKSLLSLVPAIYAKDFQGLTASGKLKLDGYAKGTYNGKTTPNVGLNLVVENAAFKYPSLPKSADNINIDLKVFWDGVQNDNTTVDLEKFHVELAQNPLDVVFHLKTPISDPSINSQIKGKIDLASIADIVPVDSMTLKGIIESNLDLMGQMSMIEKQKYEDFKADGSISLTNFEFKSPALKQGANIQKAVLNFSPKFVDLTAFDMQIGKTDIHLKGKLTNFIPYALKNETIHGNLDFSSQNIDLNEFMGGEAAPDTVTKTDTAQLATVEVPKNIDFTLTSKIGKLIFDKLEITNMAGAIKVNDGKVSLDNVFMNLLQGSMSMSGEYNTQDMSKPSADFKFNMKDIDIPSTYTTFNTVKKLAPLAENARGKISVTLNFSSLLDAHMSPVLSSINGEGKLQSKEVQIVNSKAFAKIADAIKNDKLKNITANDVNLSFKIREGRIYIDPFDTKVFGNKVNISGDQGLDQTMNYVMKMAIPAAGLSAAANQLGGIAGKSLSAIGSMVNANVLIQGTFTDPKVSVKLTTAENKEAKEAIKEAVKQEVTKAVKEEVGKRAADILAKAQEEANNVKAEAKKAADLVRQESAAGANKLVQQASNPIAKAAAKKGAEKMKKEGEEKAKKIETEGNQKADAIMQKAQAEADKLK